MGETLRLQMVGDLILDEPNSDALFDLARPQLRECDVLVGHVEVPHTGRGTEKHFDVPAPASDPANLAALRRAGFHVATLAGNHIADAGLEDVEDTIAELRRLGIATTGAGMNLAEARQPAIVDRPGLRLGFLSYNCVGPRESWAGRDRAGCAYIQVLTHYELDHASPGGPPTVYTFAEPRTLDAMMADVEELRTQVNVLAVALHKGLGHTPATVAMYERQLAKAAIDAGADVVVGHHAHILQGMEIYRDRPIFHGLGNFAIATKALNIDGNSSPERRAWAERRRKLFGFEPDPEYTVYPFHPEAKNALLAFCEVDPGGVRTAGFRPCFVNRNSQPEVLGNDERGQSVARYVEDITLRAGLNAAFEWAGDRVEFYRRKNL
ncbi:MAG TPA: CapA family protein [Bryobacteraceae bacterium]|jgi:poly-gamma-glutamate synthesis protein (capsule biosynthesis protein)